MIEISGDECFNKLDEQGYLVYYFTASWCKPCQRILGDIIKLSEDDNYNVSFYKIEITDEDNNEICEKCGIKSVPSFLLFKDRTYIDRTVGANIKNLKEMIENIITNKKVVKD